MASANLNLAYIAMKPRAALLIAIALLSFLTAILADEARAVSSKDGLELIVTMLKPPGAPQLLFECRLHNTTDQDIPFDLSGQTFRLAFQALDAGGKDIPMTPEGAKEYDWRRTEHLRHCSDAIHPGTDRVFTFRPGLAFGEGWKSATHLLVSWEPGFDWAWPQKPYTKGRGLAVTYPIPKADTTDSKETKPVPPIQPAAPDSKAAPKTAEVQSASSLPWSVMVVLAATAAWVLRQVFKRRS